MVVHEGTGGVKPTFGGVQVPEFEIEITSSGGSEEPGSMRASLRRSVTETLRARLSATLSMGHERKSIMKEKASVAPALMEIEEAWTERNDAAIEAEASQRRSATKAHAAAAHTEL